VQRRSPRRIATISLHTSPLDQPGTGDAGGLNVYVVEVSKRLAERGIEVEIFTRAVCRDTPPTVELVPGVLVRNVVAGPFEELDKNALPAQICSFTFEVLRTEAAFAPGRYDLLHAHYWLSGQVAARAAERWGVPLVQSMHTLGKVKNLALATGDCAEPAARIQGEASVVAAADRLVANTAEEARQLIELYGADPWRIETVSPGVDLSVFSPVPSASAAPGSAAPGSAASASAASGLRRRLGLPADAVVLVFAGRIQPLKGPDVVLRAAAALLRSCPSLSDRLVANTAEEARQLIELYGADPWRIETVSPGVDLSVFSPASAASGLRRRLGLPADAVVLVFAGRIQPLKGPDVVLRAAAALLRSCPSLSDRLVVAIVGGPSGSEVGAPGRLSALASGLGISEFVRLEPPCPQRDLADWYRAADIVLVPSHSESFGLVALEAQACGTPVVAAAVGGLRTAVRDGYSGVLVDGHDPVAWARVLRGLLASPRRRAQLSRGALAHASRFGWAMTAERLIGLYGDAISLKVRAADLINEATATISE
jgi:glycosyltransferase involved in cell wall biosynthesis